MTEVNPHFTYEATPRADLQQGDLIRRTPEVEEILKEVHPHYGKSQGYDYFLVLTQSCDLVRRDTLPCKSHYITIAAVRPLRKALDRELAGYQKSELERQLGFCSSERQSHMTMFVQRLFNNTEPDYFYLHREPSVGLNQDFCAFLKLSIAIKADLHYENLLTARVLQLKDSFQHKLGYLVGTMYSKIGTEDWNDHKPEEFRSKTSTTISDLVLWLDKQQYKQVLDRLREQSQTSNNPLTPDDLEQALHAVEIVKENRKQAILDALQAVLIASGIEENRARNIKNRFAARSEFSTIKV